MLLTTDPGVLVPVFLSAAAICWVMIVAVLLKNKFSKRSPPSAVASHDSTQTAISSHVDTLQPGLDAHVSQPPRGHRTMQDRRHWKFTSEVKRGLALGLGFILAELIFLAVGLAALIALGVIRDVFA